MTKLRIYLVDDHPVVRSGLRNLVDSQIDMAVVGEASDGETAVHEAPCLRPDVVIMDLSMPGVGGEEATIRLRRDCPAAKVLALTAHEDPGYLKRLLAAGASGYVLKRVAASELIDAVRSVATGKTYVDTALAAQALSELSRRAPDKDAELSEREAEVLRLVAQGYLVKQIAVKLGIEGRTVETYKARAMEKLGLNSRVGVVRYAAQHDWFDNS